MIRRVNYVKANGNVGEGVQAAQGPDVPGNATESIARRQHIKGSTVATMRAGMRYMLINGERVASSAFEIRVDAG